MPYSTSADSVSSAYQCLYMPAPTIELTALMDPRLVRLLHADEGEVDHEIERLIVDIAQPLIASITGRAARSGTVISRHDVDDLTGTIHLRLVAKLRAITTSPEEAVRDLERYVATLTYNVVNDHLRKAFPQRTRLKNRLRYILTHDERLALWEKNDALACGLAPWRGSDAIEEIPLDPVQATGAMCDRECPADAVVHVLERVHHAVAFDGLVSFTAKIWDVVDIPARETELRLAEAPDRSATQQMETREYLRALWAEIRELRPMQRKALLLNLRSSESDDVAALLVLTGVASFDEIASAVGMTPAELAAIWNDLPLDDLRIASLLDVTRQQVINLRRSARERLTRRMSR